MNGSLEERVTALEERNRKVERDKAWETSATRKVVILIITYILLALYMWFINVTDPFVNAIVPAAGFLLSTLTLSWIRDLWLKKNSQK